MSKASSPDSSSNLGKVLESIGEHKGMAAAILLGSAAVLAAARYGNRLRLRNNREIAIKDAESIDRHAPEGLVSIVEVPKPGEEYRDDPIIAAAVPATVEAASRLSKNDLFVMDSTGARMRVGGVEADPAIQLAAAKLKEAVDLAEQPVA